MVDVFPPKSTHILNLSILVPAKTFPAKIHIFCQKSPAKSAYLAHFPPKTFPAKPPIVAIPPVEVFISGKNVHSSHFSAKMFPEKYCIQFWWENILAEKMQAMCIFRRNMHMHRMSLFEWTISYLKLYFSIEILISGHNSLLTIRRHISTSGNAQFVDEHAQLESTKNSSLQADNQLRKTNHFSTESLISGGHKYSNRLQATPYFHLRFGTI